jgi:hypothetical protein
MNMYMHGITIPNTFPRIAFSQGCMYTVDPDSYQGYTHMPLKQQDPLCQS